MVSISRLTRTPGCSVPKVVAAVVDVRTKPYSRYCPQFNQSAFEAALRAAGLAYYFKGTTLGGLGQPSPAMAAHLDAFAAHLAGNPQRGYALVCAEKNPLECHRFYWLSNYLSRAHGLAITHLVPGPGGALARETALPYPALPAGLAHAVPA